MKKISTKNDLIKLRDKLDDIDQKLIVLFGKRFQVTHKVGLLKKELDLPAEDKDREKLQFKRIENLSKEAQLDANIAKKLFRLIIKEVKKNHKKLKENLNAV